MSTQITGQNHSLSKVFSSDYEYIIPDYQRPYSWGVEQTEALFDDLYGFWKGEFENRVQENQYFLGSIVLEKQESRPKAHVIDGQQRLTTLTIFLSILASLFTEDTLKKNMLKFLKEEGNEFEQLESKPRLEVRKRDSEFFNKFIQNQDFEGLHSLDDTQLLDEGDSRYHIKHNSIALIKNIKENFSDKNGRLDEEQLKKFAVFVVTHCSLVVITTPSEESAYRVFSVLNSRGMELQATDILKSEIIGRLKEKYSIRGNNEKIVEEKRENYANKWEELEDSLGRDSFNDLFSYTLMLHKKEKPRRALLEEYRNLLFSPDTPKDLELFLDNELKPNAKALIILKKENYVANKFSDEINNYIHWLNKLNFSDWRPSAIIALARYGSYPSFIHSYFKGLERLCAFMHINALNINKRLELFKNLIKEIDTHIAAGNTEPPKSLANLDLKNNEKEDFLNTLNGNIYHMTGIRRNYLLLRLDSFIAAGEPNYHSNKEQTRLTLEHILPIKAGDEWLDTWPDEEQRAEWIHKLANLIPLNKNRNSSASNLSFEKKKKKYYQGSSDLPPYALTWKISTYDEWTPKTIAAHQELLINILKKEWDL